MQVAAFSTNMTIVADIQWDKTVVSDIDVHYSLLRSNYTINAKMWDSTVVFLVRQLQDSTGVARLFDTFVLPRVSRKLHIVNPTTLWRDGWYQLSADLNADELVASDLGGDEADTDSAAPVDEAASTALPQAAAPA